MKNIKSIVIAPFTYAIKRDPKWATLTGNMGNCITDTQTIMIDASLTDAAERDTVLHEALHGIWGQTPLQKSYTEEQQEEVIWTLTPRLLGLLLDNPEFVTWLLGT